MSAVMLERDAVMAAVRGLLRDALGGRGGTLFVVGEAGMGKTTVLQYAVAAAGDRFRTGTGQADVAEAATFLSCGNRGLKTSAIWLIFVAAHAEKLVGLTWAVRR